MIVLSRQRDESFMIGDDIEVIIVDIRGDKVRLGITVPKELDVHRREIYDAIQHEKKQKVKEKHKMATQEMETDPMRRREKQCGGDDFKEACDKLVVKLETLKDETMVILRRHPAMVYSHVSPTEQQKGMGTNLTLAFQCLEDAAMRFDKAAEAYSRP